MTSVYVMQTTYEGSHKLDTDDLLTALKQCMNYESELYMNGTLVFSPMGFEMEHNAAILKDYGITMYVSNGRWKFKYTDESKNPTTIYALINQYIWEGVKHLDVSIHDYQAYSNDVEFKDYNECIQFVDLCYNNENIAAENIKIIDYRIDCKISTLYKVMEELTS